MIQPTIQQPYKIAIVTPREGQITQSINQSINGIIVILYDI